MQRRKNFSIGDRREVQGNGGSLRLVARQGTPGDRHIDVAFLHGFDQARGRGLLPVVAVNRISDDILDNPLLTQGVRGRRIHPVIANKVHANAELPQALVP